MNATLIWTRIRSVLWGKTQLTWSQWIIHHQMEYNMNLSQVGMSCNIHISCLQVLCRARPPGLYKHRRQISSMPMVPVYHYTGHLIYLCGYVCGPNSEPKYRFVILAKNVMPVGTIIPHNFPLSITLTQELQKLWKWQQC